MLLHLLVHRVSSALLVGCRRQETSGDDDEWHLIVCSSLEFAAFTICSPALFAFLSAFRAVRRIMIINGLCSIALSLSLGTQFVSKCVCLHFSVQTLSVSHFPLLYLYSSDCQIDRQVAVAELLSYAVTISFTCPRQLTVNWAASAAAAGKCGQELSNFWPVVQSTMQQFLFALKFCSALRKITL